MKKNKIIGLSVLILVYISMFGIAVISDNMKIWNAVFVFTVAPVMAALIIYGIKLMAKDE